MQRCAGDSCTAGYPARVSYPENREQDTWNVCVVQRARPEFISIRHWELLLCKALHEHLPKPVLAPNTLDVSWGKADEVGGQEVQEKQDNAGYHTQPLPKIPSASKEMNSKTLKVDKVAFWVAFPVFTGICNTSFDSPTTTPLMEVPGTVSRAT